MSWTTRWDVIWQAVKDILLTGTGMTLILTQVFARTPSDVLLVTGLALTVPSVAGHAGALLAPTRAMHAGRGGSSSAPSPPPGSPPSGPSSEDPGER